jgi:ABC-type polysaccharide/polyol phosphate transport system ATPase subunit
MGARSTPAHAGSSVSDADSDAGVVVEGVSKRYPGIPLPLYPPMVSIFHRQLLRRKRTSRDDEESRSSADDGRKRSSAEDGRRRPPSAYDDPDSDDEDLDDEEEDDDEEDFDRSRIPVRPGPFWALRDVSFRVPPGGTLGVLGGPGSGKSTLLRILSGGARPTEGRVLIRDPVWPLPAELAKGLAYTCRGSFKFHMVLGCRMFGIPAQLVKRHRDEIEELARPQPDYEGNPDRESMIRLAVATVVVLPASVILLEEPLVKRDEAFTARVVERVRERVQSGSALVLASREPELVRELCDEAIWLDKGSIVERDRVKGTVRRYAAAQGGKKAGGKPASSELVGPSQDLSQGRKVRVPPVVPAFNASAALHSATLSTASGRSKRIDAAADEVWVEIRFGTALPDVEAHCGIGFTPRGGEGTGIRLELPEPLRFASPRTYVLTARIPPGTLRVGVYAVRADAVVSSPAKHGASVIAAKIGRVRIVGDEPDRPEPDEPPVPHWDGSVSWRADAEWSIA